MQEVFIVVKVMFARHISNSFRAYLPMCYSDHGIDNTLNTCNNFYSLIGSIINSHAISLMTTHKRLKRTLPAVFDKS